ncbi:MAG: helix-turn-helix transcriptional regulator [Lachnospiraceae bacterium]|nr:helix-turn-helix transcriptional regulator [Lachnospiraceae bacterium]
MPKENGNNKSMGLFFKKARNDKKLTYEEVAELSGISSRYLKDIENKGHVPSFKKIKQLVCALETSPMPLFYENVPENTLAYQQLQIYLSKCSEEQITAILAIVEAYLRTYKNPT